MRHLPRLAREHYQSFAVAHWTVTIQDRATGWLDDLFHAYFRELLLHAAAREGLLCPAYCLMPDHIHLIWMGMKVSTDQLLAMRFLRRWLAAELSRKSIPQKPFELQKQSHDSVLREEDRKRNAFARTCFYVLENPVRKELVAKAEDWPHLGAIIPGFPDLNPLQEECSPTFWKQYEEQREPMPLDAPRTS